MTFFLLVGASLLGFSSVMPTTAASLSIDDTNTSTTTTADGNDGIATTMSDSVSSNAIPFFLSFSLPSLPFPIFSFA